MLQVLDLIFKGLVLFFQLLSLLGIFFLSVADILCLLLPQSDLFPKVLYNFVPFCVFLIGQIFRQESCIHNFSIFLEEFLLEGGDLGVLEVELCF